MNYKSRRINLTGIHAINWYGYSHDYIPVSGNFLLAGIMGSGKSILMDLIQHVLVGNEKARYNASATGAKAVRGKGRTYKGYCLGDLKDEVDGVPQYFRPKGAITVIALEFTWPDGQKKETWGFRTEWANAVQASPSRNDPFYFPCALGKHELLNGETRCPLDIAAFKELVKARKGKIFETIEEYRRDMANGSHLNFDRGTIDYLLPSAMSFTFLEGGFNQFCRRYILPEESLRTDDVRDSYLAFKKLENDLREIEDKVNRLTQIKKSFGEWSSASSNLICYEVLQKEFGWNAAIEVQAGNLAEIARLERENAECEQSLLSAQNAKDEAESRRDKITALINATPDGPVFLMAQQENTELVREIERLRGIGETVAGAVRQRLKLTRQWLESLKSSGFQLPKEIIAAVESSHAALAEAPRHEIGAAARSLASAVDAARNALERSTRPLRNEFTENLAKQQKFQREIEGLRSGNPIENAILLTALNRELPPRGGRPAARALREVCEVNDERWRAALEVVFGLKFAVLVDEGDFRRADQIFYELKANAPTESLVLARRAVQLPRKVHPDSLATKLDSDHPVARAIIDHYLGEIVCVDRVEDMDASPTGKAVTPDGYQQRGAIKSRARHYDHRPYIGQRGLERQKQYLEDQRDEYKRANERLKPELDLYDGLAQQVSQYGLTRESIHDDLWEAAQLPQKEKKLADNIAILNRCREAGLAEKEEELQAAKKRIKDLEAEILSLTRSSKHTELEAARKRQPSLLLAVEQAKLALDSKISEVGARLVIATKESLATHIAQTHSSSETAATACGHMASSARTEAGIAWTKVQSFRREMADRYPTMQGDPDYEIEDPSNVKYDQLLERLVVKDIAATRSKAARERVNWQNLFRSTVAAKLNSALIKAEDLRSLMNTLLARPIGSHIYSIRKVENPDPEYATYRKLLETCAHSSETDDLFASLEGDVRRDIEALFTAIIEQPDSRNALQFLDYRNYHEYNLMAADANDSTKPPVNIDKHGDKLSGGENQSPYFIAILACYLRAYKRHLTEKAVGPSICLVPIDEAFSKMSGDGIPHSIAALQELGLQGFLSMSSGNIPYAIEGCDQVLSVSKKKTRNAHGDAIRNIAVALTRVEAHKKFCTLSDARS